MDPGNKCRDDNWEFGTAVAQRREACRATYVRRAQRVPDSLKHLSRVTRPGVALPQRFAIEGGM
jgi:hypothetical protein